MNKIMKEYSSRRLKVGFSDEAREALRGFDDEENNAGVMTCEDLPTKRSKHHADQKKIVRRSKSYTDKDLSRYAKALRKTTTLEELNLGWNKITLLNKRFNLAISSNSTLKRIYLIGNEIGDRGIAKFADALKKNETLEVVGLSNNQISDKGVASVADALKTNHSIRKLYLSSNYIKAEGAKLLADALTVNDSLQEYWLNDNDISAQGAEAFVSK